jgi:hypothetical protein
MRPSTASFHDGSDRRPPTAATATATAINAIHHARHEAPTPAIALSHSAPGNLPTLTLRESFNPQQGQRARVLLVRPRSRPVQTSDLRSYVGSLLSLSWCSSGRASWSFGRSAHSFEAMMASKEAT